MSKPALSMQARARVGRWLVSGPPVLYLLVFFAAPALIMVLASFRTPGDFGGLAPLVEDGRLDLNLDSYARFFTESVYAQIFVKSVWYALLTTLFCLLLAYPLAALIARSAKKHRDLLLLLVILPFWSNFLIRIYAWMIILGPNAALAKTVNGVLDWFGHEPVPLLTPTWKSTIGLCSMPRRIWVPAHGSGSGASRSRCRCPASMPARRWCSFPRWASSPFRISSAAPKTASSATSSSSSSWRPATGRSAACCRSC
jgi:ABC-type sugar transport system permease subunit